MLTHTAVKFRLFTPDGAPAEGLMVSARLTRPDTDSGAVVPAVTISGKTDEAGECTLNLWPNARGTTGSQYRVNITGSVLMVDAYTITVPESLSTVLVESIKSTPPYPTVSAAQQALEAAQQAVADAAASASAAQASEMAAADSATASAASAADAAASASVAQASELAAADSAAEAAASAADAAASASAAQASKLAAADSATASAASALTSSAQSVLAATSAEAAAASAADAATSQGLAGTYATTAEGAAVAAQAAANNAVAVVTATASLTAAAGKIPIADASGKIDPAWLDPIAGVTAAALHRSPNAITALFVYDTSKDSDGGAWTERCQHTSWYNEPINGKWLGAQESEFYARNTDATLGAENVVNSRFDTDTTWTKGTGWSIGSGVAIKTAGASAYLSQPTTFVSGKTYRFEFTISGRTAGNIGARLENAAVALRSTNGTFVEYITTNSSNPRIILSADSNFNGSVDNISVREVTALTAQTGDYFQLSTDGKFYRLNAGSGTSEVFRGNKRDFPRLSAIVAEAASVTIYDLTEPGRPMWMRFAGGIFAWLRPSDVTSVYALNGTIISGSTTTALNSAYFPADKGYIQTAAAKSEMRGTIALRNTSTNWYASSGPAIANNAVNAVAMTVLPDAPVDPVTGLRVPTIAVSTIGGISIIKHDGSVFSATTSAFNGAGIVFTPKNDLTWVRGADSSYYLWPYTNWSSSSTSVVGFVNKFAASNASSGAPQIICARGSFRLGRNGVAAPAIVSPFTENRSSASKSINSYITNTYNTGHMVGDIRRAYLADASAGSIGPSTELITNGTFDTADGWAPNAGWTISGGVATFSASNGSLLSYVSAILQPLRVYAVEFDVTYTSGSVYVSAGGSGSNPYYASGGSGRKRVLLFARSTANGVFNIGALGASSLSVDNISVKEVVADRSYKAQGATITGTLTKTAVATDAQLVAYSGFSASNYLQEPYSADLDFGTGEWSCSAWVTVPTGNAAAGTIASRAYSSGASITLGIDASNKITATAYDGTTTRTVTTTGAYNTDTRIKVRAAYRAGRLALSVNGVEMAVTHGTPLLTLNNSNAVLTIGNSYALDAPFPGSIALLKFSATVPTAEQAAWVYDQEKQMFRAGAQVCLPDSGAVVDLTYDDATDKWIAASASNRSEWAGLVRTGVTAVPAGSYSKAAAGSGVLLTARSTTSPGVDVTLPELGLRRELARRAEAAARLAAQPAVLDYVGGFTATTTNGSSSLTSVSGLSVPGAVNLVGCQVTGSGIPASTTITGISGTTIYLSAAATAGASGVQISLVDFPLPTGLEAKTVSVAGALKQEGGSATWTRQYDGFREAVRFGTAPGYNAWVQITAIRSVS